MAFSPQTLQVGSSIKSSNTSLVYKESIRSMSFLASSLFCEKYVSPYICAIFFQSFPFIILVLSSGSAYTIKVLADDKAEVPLRDISSRAL